MKTSLFRFLPLLVGLTLLSGSPLRATQWEFGIKVKDNNQPAALDVYLYRSGNLTIPYRQGRSESLFDTSLVNFRSDIADEGFQEPNTGNATWHLITPGSYYLRIGTRYVSLTVSAMDSGINRDFTITFDGTNFSPYSGNRYTLGTTATWSATTVSVLVDQRLEDGTTVGSVKRFDSDEFIDLAAPIPVTMPMTVGSEQVLLADQALYSSQRYNNWNLSTEVVNHRVFDIASGTSQLVARFRTMHDGVSIASSLLEHPSSSSDSIDFKDPWFIDYQDPNYASHLRNRGLSAVFHRRAVPFTPDATTQYEENQPYHGVFLNENNEFSPGAPCYMIAAPSPRTIGSFSACFDSWSGSDAEFQHSRAETTLVVFTSSDAVVTARYKAHLGTSLLAATGPNNQRRIVYACSAYHLVYESAGEIWYATSSDGGSSWTAEVRLSDGSGLNRAPSISGRRGGSASSPYLAAVWEKFDPSAAESIILLSYRDNTTHLFGSPSEIGHCYAVAEGFLGATPVLAMDAECECVIWAYGASSEEFPSGLQLWLLPLASGSPFQAVLSGTGVSSLYPSCAEYPSASSYGTFGVAYSDNGVVTYRKFWYDSDRDDLRFDAAETVSGGSYLNSHQKPSLIYEDQQNGRPVVAWQAYWVPLEATVILVRRRDSGTWGTITQYAENDANALAPSLSRYPSSTNLAMCYTTDREALALARYTSGAWQSRSLLSATGRAAMLGLDYDGESHLRTLYTTGSSAPYTVSTTTQGLTKGSGSPIEVLTREVTVREGNVFASIALAGETLGETMAAGSLPYTPYADSVLIRGEEQAARFLSLAPTGGAPVRLTVTTRIVLAQGIQEKEGALMSPAEILLERWEHATGRLISERSLGHLATSPGKADTAQELTLDLGAPEGTAPEEWRLRLHCEQEKTRKWIATIIHLSSSKGSLEKQEPSAASHVGPRAYALDAPYPNPFNPVSQLHFALRDGAQIRLVVFDILGREVALLADGAYPAGEHTVRWNASSCASGIYYARLRVSDPLGEILYEKTRRLILAK